MKKSNIYHGLLICGMTPTTAGRYLVVRTQIDLIIDHVNKTGRWFCEFRNVRPDGLCKTLTDMGRLLLHATAQLEHYLDNEFVSIDKIRTKADELNKMHIDGRC